MALPRLKAPFPWFGGKSTVAHLVWERFGDVPNYVEPFFGSGAVMLARPHPPRIETINDLDCYVANFWRAVTDAPKKVAQYADWPVNEADLHARHKWLVNRERFRERMKSEPGYYNAKIAGWWVWGISCWIGSGWCCKPEWAGRINASRAERGVHAYNEARRPNMTGNGVHRQTTEGRGQKTAGFEKTRPNLQPQGVHSKKAENRGHKTELTSDLRPLSSGPRTLQKRPRISGYSGAGVHRKLGVPPDSADSHLACPTGCENENALPQKVPNIGDRGGRGVANVALGGTPEERFGTHAPARDRDRNRIDQEHDYEHEHEEERNPRNAGLHVWEKRPALHRSARGVSRQLPDLGGDCGATGRGVHASGRRVALIEWMQALADRLRCVRVCCGDWKRVLGRSPTECIGITGVFLDPPYGGARDTGIYSQDSMEVASEVRKWAIAHGKNPKLRIALCGYEGEHLMPDDWSCIAWKANGGHGNAAQGRGRANAARERIWFSPHCLSPSQPELL